MNISMGDRTEGLDRTSLPLWDIVLSMFYMLIFIFAVPGNSLALWAFCHQKGTSPSKVFLRNLSIADICYVLLLPMRIVYHLSDSHWPFGDIPCRLSGFLFYLNMYCSLYLMSFISLDRLLAVIFPLKSQVVRKPLHANIGVAILWMIVTASMMPSLFSKKNQSNTDSRCTMLYLESTSSKALISTMVAFLIPFTTIVITYIVILLKLRNLKQQEQRPVKDKAMKMIVLVVMNFLFAFVPYHICRVIYTQKLAGSLESLKRANQVTSALTCIGGVLDPVMYFFLNKVYRSTFLHLFCKPRRRGL
ncbi:uracil nucleotide/cysteinyl leukotriene receptor [Fundulus diaphanus]